MDADFWVGTADWPVFCSAVTVSLSFLTFSSHSNTFTMKAVKKDSSTLYNHPLGAQYPQVPGMWLTGKGTLRTRKDGPPKQMHEDPYYLMKLRNDLVIKPGMKTVGAGKITMTKDDSERCSYGVNVPLRAGEKIRRYYPKPLLYGE